MGEIAERQRQAAIELRARFPAAYARLSGKRWQAFVRVLEEGRPAPPAPPGDAPTEPVPERRWTPSDP